MSLKEMYMNSSQTWRKSITNKGNRLTLSTLILLNAACRTLKLCIYSCSSFAWNFTFFKKIHPGNSMSMNWQYAAPACKQKEECWLIQMQHKDIPVSHNILILCRSPSCHQNCSSLLKQDLWGCAVVSRTKMFTADPLNPVQCEVGPLGSDYFVQLNPQLLNWMEIWGIWRLSQHLCHVH